ncbi:MAG: CinA family protein [Candidatus Lokiarchaeota archaeon]|nr:CinA family protein [Candidatus Lokiarchaeota archaeon]
MEIKERLSKIIKNFNQNNIKIAIAESCTGGYISHMITNISGASKVFERGIVCYSNQAKIDLVNVNPSALEMYGAVSENVVDQLARNIRILADVDIGIGISGIAGPTGGTPEKPVGTVYVGFSTKKVTKVNRYNFKADRITFKELVLEKIINYLEQKMSKGNYINERTA